MRFIALLFILACQTSNEDKEQSYIVELSGAEIIQLIIVVDGKRDTLHNQEKYGSIINQGSFEESLRVIAEHQYTALRLKITINNKQVYNDSLQSHYLEFK